MLFAVFICCLLHRQGPLCLFGSGCFSGKTGKLTNRVAKATFTKASGPVQLPPPHLEPRSRPLGWQRQRREPAIGIANDEAWADPSRGGDILRTMA